MAQFLSTIDAAPGYQIAVIPATPSGAPVELDVLEDVTAAVETTSTWPYSNEAPGAPPHEVTDGDFPFFAGLFVWLRAKTDEASCSIEAELSGPTLGTQSYGPVNPFGGVVDSYVNIWFGGGALGSFGDYPSDLMADLAAGDLTLHVTAGEPDPGDPAFTITIENMGLFYFTDGTLYVAPGAASQPLRQYPRADR